MSKTLSTTLAMFSNGTAKINIAVLFAGAVLIFVVTPHLAKASTTYVGPTGSTFTTDCDTTGGGGELLMIFVTKTQAIQEQCVVYTMIP